MTSPTQGTSVPSIFQFDSHEIRTLVDDQGEPWFCAADICTVLSYQNSRLTIQKHCRLKGVSKRYTPTEGGQQELTFINEGNLYRLIIKSRLPAAERFEAWVCAEILPAIRKTGRYEAASSPNPMSDEALANLRLSSPHGRWLLSFGPDGRAYLQQIERYSFLVEPKYLFKLLDAARDIQAFVEYFGLETHYAPLRTPSDLKSEARVRTETIPHPRSSLK